jgi:hypothetical protein
MPSPVKDLYVTIFLATRKPLIQDSSFRIFSNWFVIFMRGFDEDTMSIKKYHLWCSMSLLLLLLMPFFVDMVESTIPHQFKYNTYNATWHNEVYLTDKSGITLPVLHYFGTNNHDIKIPAALLSATKRKGGV